MHHDLLAPVQRGLAVYFVLIAAFNAGVGYYFVKQRNRAQAACDRKDGIRGNEDGARLLLDLPHPDALDSATRGGAPERGFAPPRPPGASCMVESQSQVQAVGRVEVCAKAIERSWQ